MRFLELKIPPPVAALLAAACMWRISRWGPSLHATHPAQIAAAVLLAAAGVAIAAAGEHEFRRVRTTANPMRPHAARRLVTSGIFRYTRNPMYGGLTLILLGMAVYLGSALTLLGPVAFVLYLRLFQIAPEERALSARFGDDYAAYTARVGRWFLRKK